MYFLVDTNSNPMKKQRWEADNTSPIMKSMNWLDSSSANTESGPQQLSVYL